MFVHVWPINYIINLNPICILLNHNSTKHVRFITLFLRLYRSSISTHLRQPWSCIRLSQSWSRHLLHGCPQTITHHEISCTCSHGWYFGYLRHDRCSYHCTKKYLSNNAVGDTYTAKSGYAHLASGLCCGFSSLVMINVI